VLLYFMSTSSLQVQVLLVIVPEESVVVIFFMNGFARMVCMNAFVGSLHLAYQMEGRIW
jgi:hypothetical protein